MSQSRVYRYGLLPPITEAQRVADQMSLGHRYSNRLVEIERSRRARARAILGSHADTEPLGADVARLERELEAALGVVLGARKAERRRAETAEQRQVVRDLRQQLRDARARLKAAKVSLATDPAVQASLRASDEQAAQAVRDARAASGLYWGTYLISEAAIDAARKGRMDPRFRRWDGSGAVAVQIQGGVTWTEACEGDTRIQIARRRNARGHAMHLLRLRVGSAGRDPIWAEWPLVLHREVPADALMMGARVVRERVEAKERWSLHLTLRLPDEWRAGRCGDGLVAVDLGWRQRPDGLRVAYLVDDAGDEREILLDGGVAPSIAKVEDLRSIRDKRLDLLRPWLAQWLREHDLPEWLRESSSHLHQWRSAARFAALALRWRAARWAGDAEAFERIEEWRKRDKHLWTWEVNLRDKVLRRRREQYRVLGAELARRYGTLVIEDMDLRDLQRHAAVESQETEIPAARSAQRLASPSELRACLVSAFASRGGRVVAIDPADSTRACHACGLVEAWDPAANLHHACTGCGTVWDQDANACRNLLARQREQSGSAEPSYAARTVGEGGPKEGRWARVARLRSERSQRDAQARGIMDASE
jgi:hypothetical protein